MVKIYLALLCVLLLIGCNSDKVVDEPEVEVNPPDLSYLQPANSESRKWLTAEQMTLIQYDQPSPIHNSHFMSIDAEASLLENFEGRLILPESQMLGNAPNEDRRGEGYLFFPGFNTDFFTQGEHFVPVKQDIMYSTGENSFWGVILSPGKIWSEASDEGSLRVALPFVLTDRLRSQTHNGIATFLYNPNDSQVSKFRFQVIQETASYFQHHFWGQLDLTLENVAVDDLTPMKALFNHYLDAIPKIESWQALSALTPKENVNAIVSDQKGEDYSSIGLHYQDTLYLQTCPTQYGDFPFCAQMRHGSFSVAKSMGAGMLLMWLSHKYGEDILDEFVTDYLSIDADHTAWDKVTLKNLIDMSSAIGELGINPENDVFSDEYNDKTGPWTWAHSAQEKLAISNSYPHYSWQPGEVLRYRTMDTFTLATVMATLVKQREGSHVNLWDLYTKEVLNPIGIPVFPAIHTIETDGSRGIPLLGTGLFPTAIETALISKLLQNKGVHNGMALLNTSVTANAIIANKTDSLPVYNDQSLQEENLQYRFSFWLKKGTIEECEYWIPRMAGYGGNFVNILPNGVSFFVYQDAFLSDYVSDAEVIANALNPLCP